MVLMYFIKKVVASSFKRHFWVCLYIPLHCAPSDVYPKGYGLFRYTYTHTCIMLIPLLVCCT